MVNNMSVAIDKEIPLPDRATGYKQKYHFYKLEIGDSMAVPFGDDKEISRFRVAASAYGNRNEKVLTSRTVYEDGVKYLRVWRVE